MCYFERQVWRIVPSTLPVIVRHCSKCGKPQPFENGKKFRMNANGKHLDVWMIFRCKMCGKTFNLSVYSRRPTQAFLVDERLRIERNDEDLIWQFAFDKRLHQKNDIILETSDVPFKVDTETTALETHGQSPWISVQVDCPIPLDIRMGKVLAQGLGLSNNAVKTHCNSGGIRSGDDDRFWKTKLTGGLTFSYRRDLF